MLELSPIKDINKVKAIFNEKKIAFSELCGCVTATCNDELLGLSLYELDNEKMTVLYIEPIGDIPLADGILRSTLHVAAERGVLNACYADTVPEEFLNKIGFIKNREEKVLDIDKLFKSCCNCGK